MSLDDELEADRQYELWKRHACNHMLQAAHALCECLAYAAEGEEVTPYINISEFLVQEAESLCPDGSSFPEYPDNVIPISQAMRRK